MRTAFVTDIHANLEALTAVLADVDAAGVDRLVCLGDIVGYGADPQACVEIIAARVAAGAIAVRGNHDDAVAEGVSGMSEHAGRAMEWTVSRLDAGAARFLSGLPIAHEEGDRLFVHASANDPTDWNYMMEAADAFESFGATEARLTFVGHTHRPALFHTLAGALYTGKTLSFYPPGDAEVPLAGHRRYLAVVGSVGQPRDGNPAAAWSLLDEEAGSFSWRRVAYDIDAAAAKIRDAGLPERLWTRLKTGR